MASLGARPSLEHFKDPAVILKVPEVVLLLVALITYCAGDSGNPAYVASVILPCLLNSLVFMMTYLLGYSQLKHTPVELALYFYYIIGLFISAVLLLASGVASLIASGVFCILLTLVYCLELYYAYIALVNRVPLPAEGDGTNPPPQGDTVDVSVISGSPPTYPGTTPSLQPGGANPAAPGPSPASVPVHHTNPIYPATMNYPPFPTVEPQPRTAIPPQPQYGAQP